MKGTRNPSHDSFSESGSVSKPVFLIASQRRSGRSAAGIQRAPGLKTPDLAREGPIRYTKPGELRSSYTGTGSTNRHIQTVTLYLVFTNIGGIKINIQNVPVQGIDLGLVLR
jgi:hypothetical protein